MLNWFKKIFANDIRIEFLEKENNTLRTLLDSLNAETLKLKRELKSEININRKREDSLVADRLLSAGIAPAPDRDYLRNPPDFTPLPPTREEVGLKTLEEEEERDIALQSWNQLAAGTKSAYKHNFDDYYTDLKERHPQFLSEI